VSDAANLIPLPRENDHLLGHEAAERTLVEAFQSGRLPHGWLLSGPRGIGKATLAYRFARHVIADTMGKTGSEAALFEAPVKGLAVPRDHPVFRQIAGGAQPNLRVLEPRTDEQGRVSSVIKVDDVRNVIAFLRQTAAEGGWRVVIVDTADDLNQNAANALLKILEEPPPNALLLLVSHIEGALLPTIRSRCCHLPLSPLADPLVRDILERWYPEMDAAEHGLLVRLAEGAPGRARDIAESGGADLYQVIQELLEILPRTPVVELHAVAERLAQGKDGRAFRTGIELLRWWTAKLVRANTLGLSAMEMAPEDQALAERLLAWRPAERWLDFWDYLGRFSRDAEALNLDRKQVILTAFLELEAQRGSL
jgi:DNA polymerase-3 subunit delta'